MESLTPEGRRYALARSADSVVANVAVFGREGNWPEGFIQASIQVMNEEAQAEKEAQK